MVLRQYSMTLRLTVLVATAGLFIVNVTFGDEEPCLAKNDVRWDPKRNKCKSCRQCEFGKGRNFSSEVNTKTGKYGDLKCIPCRPCPENTFDVDFNNDCQPCNVDRCAKEHKHVGLECTVRNDIKCGACLSGYYNPTGDGFPCIKEDKATTKHTNTEHSTTGPPDEISTRFHVKVINLPAKEDELEQQSQQDNSVGIPIYFIIGIPLAAILLVVTGVFVIDSKYKTSWRKKPNLNKDSSSVTSSHAHEQDIEMDGFTQNIPENQPHKDSSDKFDINEKYLPGELASESCVLIPHPELSREIGSSNTGPECRIPSNTYQCSRKYNQVCHCDLSGQNSCHTCRKYTDIFKGIKIKKGDNYVALVSKHICHDPVGLFHKLNIPDSQIYQFDDDRQRDPEKISQREYIQRLLNTHLEKEEMDLVRLSGALCASNYHHINDKIKQTLVIKCQDNICQGTYL